MVLTRATPLFLCLAISLLLMFNHMYMRYMIGVLQRENFPFAVYEDGGEPIEVFETRKQAQAFIKEKMKEKKKKNEK